MNPELLNGEAGRLFAPVTLFALARFLENHGEDFLSWRDGCIVIETYYDKQFRALGGDTNRLISFFEDYYNMNDAARYYIAALRKPSKPKTLNMQTNSQQPTGGASLPPASGSADTELMKARSIGDALAAALMGEYSRADALGQWAADLKLPDNQCIVDGLKSEGIPVEKWERIHAKVYPQNDRTERQPPKLKE